MCTGAKIKSLSVTFAGSQHSWAIWLLFFSISLVDSPVFLKLYFHHSSSQTLSLTSSHRRWEHPPDLPHCPDQKIEVLAIRAYSYLLFSSPKCQCYKSFSTEGLILLPVLSTHSTASPQGVQFFSILCSMRTWFPVVTKNKNKMSHHSTFSMLSSSLSLKLPVRFASESQSFWL